MADLSLAQKRTLRDAIKADAVLPRNPSLPDLFQRIADALNKTASPDFIVWRTSVPEAEILNDDAFAWDRVDNLSQAKERIWTWLVRAGGGGFFASKANVRAGVDKVWVGTQADLAVRAVVYAHFQRPATVAEKILAAAGSPATLTFEGTLDAADVQEALAS